MRPPPPPPPPPPRSRPLNDTKGEEEIKSEEELKPLHHQAEPDVTVTKTPLKDAADLIESLEISCVEMTNFAADAARDAEVARKNARAASEIARRYTVRSFPKSKSQFIFGSSPPRRTRQEISRDLNKEAKENILGDKGEGKGLNSNLERRKIRRTKNATSMERIAQSHADEILALSIELEKAKQDLKSEQKKHMQTKTKLEDSELKLSDFQNENETLKERIGTDTVALQATEAEYEKKLANSKFLLEAAEEDAQLALELAQESTEERDEIDQLLKKALRELQDLKNLSSDKRMVRFADHKPPPPPPKPVPSTPLESRVFDTMSPAHSSTPRAMVSAGRQLLRRSIGTPDQEIVNLELSPKKSAERRRRLRQRLMQTEDDGIPSPKRLPVAPRPDPVNQMLSAEDLLEITRILQESGQRLDLGGHWWRDDITTLSQDFRLEAMARQYCQSVEVSAKRL